MPKKPTKEQLTLIEKARILLECFDGDFYGPKDQIVFKIDSPNWALKLMSNFGFGGKAPNTITTYLIMRVCDRLNLYPKSSSLQAIEEVILDDTVHMLPNRGEMLEWLKLVPSSWDYLTESMQKNSNMMAEGVMLAAYRNYYKFISDKVIEFLKSEKIQRSN